MLFSGRTVNFCIRGIPWRCEFGTGGGRGGEGAVGDRGSRNSLEQTLAFNSYVHLTITTIRIQRPCYRRGSPCQDPAGNRTTRRPSDHRKEAQTAVVRSCIPFIRSDQNHLTRHSERGKKTRQTEEEVGRQHQGMDGLEFGKYKRAVENRGK